MNRSVCLSGRRMHLQSNNIWAVYSASDSSTLFYLTFHKPQHLLCYPLPLLLLHPMPRPLQNPDAPKITTYAAHALHYPRLLIRAPIFCSGYIETRNCDLCACKDVQVSEPCWLRGGLHTVPVQASLETRP